MTRGKIFSEISAKLQYVCHKVRVYHVDVPEARSLDIRNTLDIRGTRNFELVMRIETNIQNKDKEFFTDLNGFQVIVHVGSFFSNFCLLYQQHFLYFYLLISDCYPVFNHSKSIMETQGQSVKSVQS